MSNVDLISRSALKEEIESLHVMVTGLRSGKGVIAEYAKHYKESVLKLIDEAQTVEAKPVEWIPCSERLPNCNGCYLVWRPHFFGGEIGMPAICYFDGQDTWHDSYGVDFTRILNEKDVIAWMPLPAPYNADMRGGKNG